MHLAPYNHFTLKTPMTSCKDKGEAFFHTRVYGISAHDKGRRGSENFQILVTSINKAKVKI